MAKCLENNRKNRRKRMKSIIDKCKKNIKEVKKKEMTDLNENMLTSLEMILIRGWDISTMMI